MSRKPTHHCLKRLKGELRLLQREPLDEGDAVPDEKDLLNWYFLILGPKDSVYEGGYYIGQLMLPFNYPGKPPHMKLLTPSGRFLPNQKICMSNTGYHIESWSAGWNIRNMIIGFLSMMMDDKEHGISHISRSKTERIRHAKNSVEYNKQKYYDIITKFTRFIDSAGNPKPQTPSKPKSPKPTDVAGSAAVATAAIPTKKKSKKKKPAPRINETGLKAYMEYKRYIGNVIGEKGRIAQKVAKIYTDSIDTGGKSKIDIYEEAMNIVDHDSDINIKKYIKLSKKEIIDQKKKRKKN